MADDNSVSDTNKDYELRALIAWNAATRALFDAGDRQAAAVLNWYLMCCMTDLGYVRHGDGFAKVCDDKRAR